MTGYCYIDNVDIFAQYGVIIAENGYDDFLTFPALVEPEVNDWAEYHGIEVDLSDLTFQPREISVPFAVISGRNWRDFYTLLTASGYRSVNIPALQKTWNLRVSEMPAFEGFSEGSIFQIKFVEDVPVINRTYPAAAGTAPLVCAVSMDGKTMDKYGIIIEDGLNDLQKPAPLKKALTRKTSTANGQVYDTQMVRFAEKEVTFKCCLAPSGSHKGGEMAAFWNLYDAFFGDLTKPGERKIGYGGRLFPAFYRKSGNFRLHAHAGEVVCSFDVTLCFSAYVIGHEIYLLSTQDDRLITTQDGYAIDLSF